MSQPNVLAQLRTAAADARTRNTTVALTPDQLDALLDVAQWPDTVGLNEEVFQA